ncbi:ABC-2 transporter permease [Lysinibacillus sp. NPDC097287]|uniref:ABC-2 transporter permease n=1 Tax=Lysinibacillus sp. NPDC097287 TaxID=3364144 RepID=UPI0038253EBD
MKALLWQRMTAQKPFILLLLLLCIFTTLFGVRFLSSFSLLFVPTTLLLLLITSMYEQDKQSKWAVFVNALPVSKKTQLFVDFLFCYGICLLAFSAISPSYFSHQNATNNTIEHFAIFAAFFSSMIWLLSLQFYVHYCPKNSNSKIYAISGVIFIILVINFPIHYYLSLVSPSAFIILIPTFFSIIPVILSFQKCVAHYNKHDIY